MMTIMPSFLILGFMICIIGNGYNVWRFLVIIGDSAHDKISAATWQ